jgi:hypothetical protein
MSDRSTEEGEHIITQILDRAGLEMRAHRGEEPFADLIIREVVAGREAGLEILAAETRGILQQVAFHGRLA